MTRIDKFVTFIFLLQTVVFVCILATLEYQNWLGLSPIVWMALTLLCVMVAMLTAIKLLPPALRANLALLMLACTLIFYAFEAILIIEGGSRPGTGRLMQRLAIRRAAQAADVDFDWRTRYQVIMQLREDGEHALPFLGPRQYTTANGDILEHLSGSISHHTVVFCNEAGTYLVYKTDRFGFHNMPDTLWDEKNIDIVAIGDSFTQGACLKYDKNFVQLIRNKRPKTLNLGVAGNGPLRALATLTEYAAPSTPQHVFWFYFEGNDLTENFIWELDNPKLLRYMEEGFLQRLDIKQDMIDSIVKPHLEQLIVQHQRDQFKSVGLWKVRHFVHAELRSLLARVNPIRRLFGYPLLEPDSVDHTSTKEDAARCTKQFATLTNITTVYEELQVESNAQSFDVSTEIRLDNLALVARTMSHRVAEWGGELTIVYLPERNRFDKTKPLQQNFRPCVLAAFEQAGVDVLDMAPVFASHPEPLSLFPFGLNYHYTAEGNALVAEHVLDYLSQ